jgi:hypothetical protein
VIESKYTRLVLLEDQVGRDVVLRGTAWSMNGRWWLDYRGETVQVENLDQLAASKDWHAAPIEVQGKLELQSAPSTGKDKTSPRLAPASKQYIVRNAQAKPIESLLGPERATGERK